MERCAGCGIEPPVGAGHPVVGIGHVDKDAVIGLEGQISPVTPRRFAAFAVCQACAQDPAHRRRVLPFTFFLRGEVDLALQEAGSNQVRGGTAR